MSGVDAWLKWLAENGRHWDRASLEAEREELVGIEAQAAAMREALELQASTHDQGHSPCHCVEGRAALATDAGKALLERLRQAEAERDVARRHQLAALRERCALVAERACEAWGAAYEAGAERAAAAIRQVELETPAG
jgi:hypothetical protein